MWGHFGEACWCLCFGKPPYGAEFIAWNVLLPVFSSGALSIPAQLNQSLFPLAGVLIAEASKELEAEIAVPSFLILWRGRILWLISLILEVLEDVWESVGDWGNSGDWAKSATKSFFMRGCTKGPLNLVVPSD